MDPTAIIGMIKTAKELLGMLKDVKDSITSDAQKKRVETLIAKSEEQLAIEDAKVAKELGYQLCTCTYPPQIMLSAGIQKGRERFQCPKCKKVFPIDPPASIKVL